MADRADENGASIGLKFRRMLVRIPSIAAAIGVCLALYMLGAGQNSLDALFYAVGITHSPQTQIGSFLIAALVVITLIVRISCNRLDAWSDDDEMDSFVRRHNSTLLLILMVGGYLMAPYPVEKAGEVAPFHGFIFRDGALVFYFLFILATEIFIGPYSTLPVDAAVAREVLKDEFYRAMRARASKVGFAVVLLAGSFALLLLQDNLRLAPAILFAVLYAGVAGSLLYYDYLIWRGDRVH